MYCTVEVQCAFCKRKFVRRLGRYNEAVKKGWKQYCSKTCQIQAKITRVKKKCGNLSCQKIVIKTLNQYKKSKTGKIFCSRSCAVAFHNYNTPKRKAKTRNCPNCNKKFTGWNKYCSSECLFKSQGVSKKQVIGYIKRFYKEKGRLPVKREYSHYKRARTLFGTWNRAVGAAGFNPNPVLFAKKFIANDGHSCDSLSEKIIDDWLYARKIKHMINIRYPGDKFLTVDFKIKSYWIEFFGLNGELKSYDRLKNLKLKIAKKKGLKLIEIYPRDLFPQCKLEKRLAFLF